MSVLGTYLKLITFPNHFEFNPKSKDVAKNVIESLFDK